MGAEDAFIRVLVVKQFIIVAVLALTHKYPVDAVLLLRFFFVHYFIRGIGSWEDCGLSVLLWSPEHRYLCTNFVFQFRGI
jgi:hypothetical protein